MADPKFPYVKWRDGRPRSSHGAYARVLGFVDGDLRHPPYDCCYIALAEMRESRLVTADDRLMRVCANTPFAKLLRSL